MYVIPRPKRFSFSPSLPPSPKFSPFLAQAPWRRRLAQPAALRRPDQAPRRRRLEEQVLRGQGQEARRGSLEEQDEAERRGRRRRPEERPEASRRRRLEVRLPPRPAEAPRRRPGAPAPPVPAARPQLLLLQDGLLEVLRGPRLQVQHLRQQLQVLQAGLHLPLRMKRIGEEGKKEGRKNDEKKNGFLDHEAGL